MTLTEARDCTGRRVIYQRGTWDPAEEGVITSVSEGYVFVRFAADTGSMACRAEDLTLIGGEPS